VDDSSLVEGFVLLFDYRTPLITLMVRLIGSKSLVMVLQGEEEG